MGRIAPGSPLAGAEGKTMEAAAELRAERGVVVVDAFSTGELLAERVRRLGFRLVLVYSQPKQEAGVWSNEIKDVEFEIYHTGDLAATLNELAKVPVRIEAVIPGAECGVNLSDALTEALALPSSNGTELSAARRNKWLMHETVRAAGVRAAKQILSKEWAEIEAFIVEWNPSPFKVIVKPNQSAGSDDVFLCTDIGEVKEAFNAINGAINSCGEVNNGTLVMEFLEGREYVIDSVSRDGDHKVVALWRYDKRKANGQFNVYFGMEVRSVESSLEMELVEYSNLVLDALNIRNGPAHMEVIITPTGPCLVEVGARCHGGHGTWATISTAAFGYSQIGATIDCYTDREAFEALPPFPVEPKRYGKEVFLVSYREGIVRGIPGMDKVQTLPSFFAKDIAVKVGHVLRKTVDLFTMPGRVQLLHDSAEQVERDYNVIHGLLQEFQMFELVSGKELQAQPEGPAEDGPAA